MGKDIENGKYKQLCAKMREDGVYVIRGRSELWTEISYNKREVILLPYDYPFPGLFVEHKHRIGHHGVLTVDDKKVSEQVMGNLPTDRLKPAPPWYSTGIDLFGPDRIRDEVKKRTKAKTYGLIFTWLGTRAVCLDIAADYSTDKCLMVL